MQKNSPPVFEITSWFTNPRFWLLALAFLSTAFSCGAMDFAVHASDLGQLLAQATPPDIKQGLKEALQLIMLFGFLMGVVLIISGAYANRNGQEGKGSIVSGALIAGSVAIMVFLYKAFGLDAGWMPF